MREPEQQTLLARLQAGDEQALAELSDAYRSKIFQLAFRYLRSREDAEEVTQDVLFKVYRKVGAFRGDAALSSWIYRITFNASMSRLRTARYQRSLAERQAADSAYERDGAGSANDFARADVADWSQMADERVLRSQLRTRVFGAILSLPAIYRAPVMLRDIQGMTTEEASAMLNVKDQTLKSRLHRGRLILRKRLADFAGGLTMHRPIYGDVRAGLELRLTSQVASANSTRSLALSSGSMTSAIPSALKRTGSAAVRVRVPLEVSGPTKQVTVCRERPAIASITATAAQASA